VEYMVKQVRLLSRPGNYGREGHGNVAQNLSPILSPFLLGVNAGRTTSTNQSHVEYGNSNGGNTVLACLSKPCHPV
jgi:hypothetical protein